MIRKVQEDAYATGHQEGYIKGRDSTTSYRPMVAGDEQGCAGDSLDRW